MSVSAQQLFLPQPKGWTLPLANNTGWWCVPAQFQKCANVAVQFQNWLAITQFLISQCSFEIGLMIIAQLSRDFSRRGSTLNRV